MIIQIVKIIIYNLVNISFENLAILSLLTFQVKINNDSLALLLSFY